ncbi:unnamed protein product [Meganyctiphanes norvegica]|uniref:Peptidase M12B propeptide domain-containing protein n=1 Tax=Meganyctiphanes norvegica TaxID=48144 RepID=A0AAV2QWB4_MEGNR
MTCAGAASTAASGQAPRAWSAAASRLLVLLMLITVILYGLVTLAGLVLQQQPLGARDEDTPNTSAAPPWPAGSSSSGQPPMRPRTAEAAAAEQDEASSSAAGNSAPSDVGPGGRSSTEVLVSWAGVVGGGREYRWWAWGREWRVRLWADSSFLAPSMLLRQEARTHATVTPPTRHAHCFHTGLLLGHPDSAIALNICKGLSGVLRVGKIVYFIEPINYSVRENVTDIRIDENILYKGNYDIRSDNYLHNNIFNTVNIFDSVENSNLYNISGDEYRYEENEEYNIFEDGDMVHVFSQMGGGSVGSYGYKKSSPTAAEAVAEATANASTSSRTAAVDAQRAPLHHCDVTGK